MNFEPHGRRRRLLLVLASTMAIALIASAAASAHAHVGPPVSVAGQTQLYNLAVPTEKEGLTTTKIVLTVPAGFSIDSFAPAPGWHREVQQTGSGEDAVIQKVTWTGGNVPTDEDSLFQFLGLIAKPGTLTFQVEQTYSDNSIVDWSGPESSESPAPTIEGKSSLGGGGTPLLAIVALIVGAVGILVAGVALVSGGGGGKRSLA